MQALRLPAQPTASQTNSKGKLEEYFAPANIVLTYASGEADAGISRVGYYSRDLFESVVADVPLISGGVLAGSATKRVELTYPPLAKAAGISGAVVVEVTVDEAGKVIAARALSGHPLLKDAAVAAARGWEFTPTQLSGQPVKVIGTITFNLR